LIHLDNPGNGDLQKEMGDQVKAKHWEKACGRSITRKFYNWEAKA